MRPRNLLSAVLLGVGLLGLTVRSIPAEAPADAGKIAKLVEQLGSETFTERQKASEVLDSIGAPALEALRKATKSTDAEVRKRATELVAKIEKRAESAGVLAPKMVQLAYKDTPLSDAVADFAKKSGYTITLHDPDGKLKDKKITLDTGKATFWNALEEFCAKGGIVDGDPNAAMINMRFGAGGPGAAPVRLVPAAPGAIVPPPGAMGRIVPVQPGQITLMAGPAVSKVSDTSSAVRIRPADKKNFRLTGKEIALVLQVSPEPRLRWQYVLSVAIDKAIDENDQKLAAVMGAGNPGVAGGIGGVVVPPGGGAAVRVMRGVRAGGLIMMPSSNGMLHYATVRLQKGAKESKSLKELTGTIAALVLDNAEQMVVADNPVKSVGKTFKGKRSGEMKILAVTKQDDGTIQINFEFEFPDGVVAETMIPVPAGATAVTPPPAPPGIGAGKGLPPVAPAGGIGGAGVFMPRFAFNGLTLRDDKDNILNGQITFNFKKAGGFAAGRRMEYIATYRPTGKDPAEPARLVYTGRREISVNVPFTLKDVELK